MPKLQRTAVLPNALSNIDIEEALRLPFRVPVGALSHLWCCFPHALSLAPFPDEFIFSRCKQDHVPGCHHWHALEVPPKGYYSWLNVPCRDRDTRLIAIPFPTVISEASICEASALLD